MIWKWFWKAPAAFTPPPVWVDIHTHIVPGIDDGAGDMDVTGAMLAAATRVGVTHVIATPHYNERYRSSDDHVVALFDRVRELRERIAPSLRLALGREVSFTDVHLEDVQCRPTLRLAGGAYVLVELPEGLNESAIIEGCFALVVAGVRPIIAHPERNWYVQQRPQLLGRLRERNALIQLDAPSVMGVHGAAARCAALAALADDQVDIVSSDAHCAEDFNVLQRACARIADRFGMALVARVVGSTPAQLLAETDHS
jgi:protein-tyrosine phosphatase